MINKLTGEPVSEEMQNVLKRLAANETVPESEIYALKEIKEANSCISSSKPTIELRNRTGIQLGVYNRLDWLWGINLTWLYTSYFDAKCSIGRVRTAVLNMLVQRENEISNFVKRPFYKAKLSNGAEWFDNDVNCLSEKIAAERILEMCKGQPVTVKSITSQKKKENRPLLFSLTSLQIAANDEFGFSAARTLSVMQSLYEKKLLTYPRTDSSYLTDDMAEILPGRVEMLRAFEEKAVNVLLSNGLNIDGRIINKNNPMDLSAFDLVHSKAEAEKLTEYVQIAARPALLSMEKTINSLIAERSIDNGRG